MRIGRGAKAALMVVAAALLVAALAPLAVSYFHDAAWRMPEADRVWVDRAVARGAADFGTTPDEYRRLTRPRVRRLADRLCVDLMTAHSNGDGSYYACWDRDGRLLSELSSGPTFGPNRISDRLRALIW